VGEKDRPWWAGAADPAGPGPGQPTAPVGGWTTAPQQPAGPGGFQGGPPYGYPPSGYWGYPHPAAGRRRRQPGVWLTAGIVAVAALAGAGLGHAIWHSATSAGPAGFLPGLGGSGGNDGSGSGPTGSGTNVSGGPADAASIAARVDPAVVDIDTTIGYQQAEAAGTGMVLTADGEVLTNNHVIEGATSIRVIDVGNGRTYQAKVVGYDRTRDVAVLQLEGASGLRTIRVGNSNSARSGQAVVAVGNAGGTNGTPSFAGGAITALGQSITASDAADGASEQLTGLIETNAGVVSGDSGGPLVGSSGRVLGMDTAASAGFRFQSAATQAFAIPINQALSIARRIESGQSSGTVHVGPTAFLGVEVSDASASGFSTSGANIAGVVPGGPADGAGLVDGDTIVSLNGQPIRSAQALTQQILSLHPGDRAQIGFVDQSGQQHAVGVTLGSGPPQ
jgi:S1-C subfamily serine protease